MTDYVERGALVWGAGRWSTGGAYVSWPFATLRVMPDRIRLTVRVWKWFRWILRVLDRTFEVEQVFELEQTDVEAIRRKRGLLSTGVIFEHRKAGYPTFMLFWTFKYGALSKELRLRGYSVHDT